MEPVSLPSLVTLVYVPLMVLVKRIISYHSSFKLQISHSDFKSDLDLTSTDIQQQFLLLTDQLCDHYIIKALTV